MIIHKATKSVETLLSQPNINFGNYDNVFVVDDNSELGQKIIVNQPYFDFVLDSDNNLIDITPNEKPSDQTPEPSEIEQIRLDIRQSNEELTIIKQTFNLIPPILNPITLQDYQQNKIYELSVSCNQHILNGFYSSCRGIEEFYSCSQLDQENIKGYIAMLGVNPNISIIWKSANETLCTPFTSEQMIQLGGDMMVHVQENIYKFELLRNQVMECVTIEEVGVITWI